MSTVLAEVGGLPDFGVAAIVTQARPDLVPTAALLLTAVIYLWGVRRLTRRGDPWPFVRTFCFIGLGLGVVALALLSGAARYDETLFGVHMAQHMLLSMVAPVFLALGAPVTLALRTLPKRPRAALLTALHSRLARIVTFPAIPWLLFVGSPFALYFSGWYPATLNSTLLHNLVHLHFLLVGCLFLWPLLGTDPIPGRVGHPFRMLMMVAALPFHAFLGIAIMSVTASGAGLIAGPHYIRLLGRQEAVFQQQVGGGLLWGSGDIISLLFLFVVLAQWMKASEREAAREDRRLDRLDAADAHAAVS